LKALTAEPTVERGKNPEGSFQRAVVAEIRALLDDMASSHLLLEGFGLDIALFIQDGKHNRARFLELKAFVGHRIGGVGVGNRRGEGTQVDLLLQSDARLEIVSSMIRWVLVNGTCPLGTRRYAIFTNGQAKQAAMGKVARGKQNNLRVNQLMRSPLTWDELSIALRDFLLS